MEHLCFTLSNVFNPSFCDFRKVDSASNLENVVYVKYFIYDTVCTGYAQDRSRGYHKVAVMREPWSAQNIAKLDMPYFRGLVRVIAITA